MSTLRGCSYCFMTRAKLSMCKQCSSVYYCNTACQKEHWPSHKADCIEAKNLKNEIEKAHEFMKSHVLKDTQLKKILLNVLGSRLVGKNASCIKAHIMQEQYGTIVMVEEWSNDCSYESEGQKIVLLFDVGRSDGSLYTINLQFKVPREQFKHNPSYDGNITLSYVNGCVEILP